MTAPDAAAAQGTAQGPSVAELLQAGRFTELEAVGRQLLTARPGRSDGWQVLGAALAGQGRHAEALEAKRKALALLPDAQAHSNLAGTLLALGHAAESADHARRALALAPEMPTAHANLGFALAALGQPGAEACWARALARDDRLTKVRLHSAAAARRRGDWRTAAQLLADGLRLQEDAQQWIELADTLREGSRMEQAVDAYRQALRLRPDAHEAWNNLGNTLHDLGRLLAAEAAYRQALRLQDNVGAVHSNLGNVLRDQGRMAEAAASFRAALAREPAFLGAWNNLLLSLHYQDGPTPAERLQVARDFGQAVSRGRPRPAHREPLAPPLRLGLVSGDFRGHPVGYFVEALLGGLDATCVLAFAYSNHAREDAVTKRLKTLVEWRPIHALSDAQAAQQIRADAIDVLIDLSGHTAHNRLPLFGHRPAPVQATWLGYFATTGVSEIDYLIADEATVPADTAEQFTEQVWRLPRTRLCFTPPRDAPEVAPLPALARGHVTFGSFQALAKVTDAVLALWGRVLQAVPGARLRLQSPQLGDEATRDALIRRMQAQGLPAERVSLHGRSSRQAYLLAHAEVDLLLDTFPFPGGTTTCEALWMGVPTLTLRGNRLIARQGGGLLMAAGLPDWVADDAPGYLAQAVQRASDLAELAHLRKTLRGRMAASALCDARAFADEFSAAMASMLRAQTEASR